MFKKYFYNFLHLFDILFHFFLVLLDRGRRWSSWAGPGYFLVLAPPTFSFTPPGPFSCILIFLHFYFLFWLWYFIFKHKKWSKNIFIFFCIYLVFILIVSIINTLNTLYLILFKCKNNVKNMFIFIFIFIHT